VLSILVSRIVIVTPSLVSRHRLLNSVNNCLCATLNIGDASWVWCHDIRDSAMIQETVLLQETVPGYKRRCLDRDDATIWDGVMNPDTVSYIVAPSPLSDSWYKRRCHGIRDEYGRHIMTCVIYLFNHLI